MEHAWSREDQKGPKKTPQTENSDNEFASTKIKNKKRGVCMHKTHFDYVFALF